LGVLSLFFFFQAEDGIRDWSVTGVQTCALPIFARLGRFRKDSGLPPIAGYFRPALALRRIWSCRGRGLGHGPAGRRLPRPRHTKIGRASCRERGEVSVVAGSLKKNVI